MSKNESRRNRVDEVYTEFGDRAKTTAVFVHTQTAPGKSDWINQDRHFLRLPAVGEYIALSAESPWYRVDLVVHCPFEADYAAEVYATEVDHIEVLKAALA